MILWIGTLISYDDLCALLATYISLGPLSILKLCIYINGIGIVLILATFFCLACNISYLDSRGPFGMGNGNGGFSEGLGFPHELLIFSNIFFICESETFLINLGFRSCPVT